MADVNCPRCGRKMRWLRRLKTFICNDDGYLLGPNDPYVKTGEVVEHHTPPGEYNE